MCRGGFLRPSQIIIDVKIRSLNVWSREGIHQCQRDRPDRAVSPQRTYVYSHSAKTQLKKTLRNSNKISSLNSTRFTCFHFPHTDLIGAATDFWLVTRIFRSALIGQIDFVSKNAIQDGGKRNSINLYVEYY